MVKDDGAYCNLSKALVAYITYGGVKVKWFYLLLNKEAYGTLLHSSHTTTSSNSPSELRVGGGVVCVMFK